MPGAFIPHVMFHSCLIDNLMAKTEARCLQFGQEAILTPACGSRSSSGAAAASRVLVLHVWEFKLLRLWQAIAHACYAQVMVHLFSLRTNHIACMIVGLKHDDRRELPQLLNASTKGAAVHASSDCRMRTSQGGVR